MLSVSLVKGTRKYGCGNFLQEENTGGAAIQKRRKKAEGGGGAKSVGNGNSRKGTKYLERKD